MIVEYKKKAETIIDEYFTSADIDEAWLSVERLDAPAYEHFFVKRLITLAMDRGIVKRSRRDFTQRSVSERTLWSANSARIRSSRRVGG